MIVEKVFIDEATHRHYLTQANEFEKLVSEKSNISRV